MLGLRHSLVRVTLALIACQLAAIVTAPMAMCCRGDVVTMAADDQACCRGLTSGHTCPLHGGPADASGGDGAAVPAPDTAPRSGPTASGRAAADSRLIAACAQSDPALVSLIGCAGELSPSSNLDPLLVTAMAAAPPAAAARSLHAPPLAPPPRF